MDCCAEEKSMKIPKLPLLNTLPIIHSPERSGTKTPPFHITVSVPFGWEEEPGKPKPCTDLVTFSNPTTFKCLELPPRLLVDTKVPSLTTVFDGPYKKDCSGTEKLGTLILKKEMGVKKKGLFRNWRKKDIKVKKHVFLSCSIDKDKDNIIGGIIGSDKNVRMRKKIKDYAKSSVWHVLSCSCGLA
ncbi:uncharacterized protein LOC127076090 isoform X2 [Lathyrus oleraceus]|uniref:Uncharacterized protein n=1 Tax=Pisum sativum TaxID=3888 RepID=A0A9D4XL91_PEA|nr:uncharacterized protein LOC127076090 isoform X2 [Pisum sativum]KAI5422044.1 hypothetical protein KIW84_045481 [Pisum sativum]